MILVTVELLPGGDATRRETIATAEIANVSELADSSSYDCYIKAHSWPAQNIGATNRHFRICGHRRAAGILPLLRRVFRHADPTLQPKEATE